MANQSTGDDDSITISADADDRSITIRGRRLETPDLALILLAIVIVVTAAFYAGVI